MVLEENKISEKRPDSENPAKDVPLKGAFNRYDSPFLQLIAPLIATRYLWLAIEDINPFNFLKKPDPTLKPDFTAWQKPSFGSTLRRNFAALGMGVTFFGIMAFYSKNTMHDIKSLYAESVGYELGKKKEDVSLWDIFVKSDNEALKVTRGAYIRRTLGRMATSATFFIPWHKFRDFKNDKPKYDANANAGVGAIGVYLLGEGFLRDPSFFDMEQNIVSTAIHHSKVRGDEAVSAQNIKTLLQLQHKHLNKGYQAPDPASAEGQSQMRLAERVAELFNQTYRNSPNPDGADLTIGKFNYLVGFGLLDDSRANLAFVELASKSKDMQDVKAAVKAIKAGAEPHAVFAQLGIDTNQLLKAPAAVTQQAESVDTTFRDAVGKAEKKTIQPKSALDFAAKNPDSQLGIN